MLLRDGDDLALGARDRAVDEAAPREEGAAQEGDAARLAGEALLVGVPVLALVSHLT